MEDIPPRRHDEDFAALAKEHTSSIRACDWSAGAGVNHERDRIARDLEAMPNLRRLIPDMITREYPRARREAMRSFMEYERERVAHYERTVPLECGYGEDALKL